MFVEVLTRALTSLSICTSALQALSKSSRPSCTLHWQGYSRPKICQRSKRKTLFQHAVPGQKSCEARQCRRKLFGRPTSPNGIDPVINIEQRPAVASQISGIIMVESISNISKDSLPYHCRHVQENTFTHIDDKSSRRFPLKE